MRESIWMGVSPGKRSSRLIAMRGPGETILKAHLRTMPASSQALARMLEAIALWEGQQVRAALVVDEEPGSVGLGLHDVFPPVDSTPLYNIEWVRRARQRRRRDEIRGMGDFGDLAQLVLFEVPR